MDWVLLSGCLLVFSARIVDVALDTLRMLSVMKGLRGRAWCLGFVQVLVWLAAVSSVITRAQEQPLLAVAYALGYATGNYVGITIERWLGHGEQVVRVFTRLGAETAAMLRGDGLGVTEFEGRGKDGPVSMLFIETPRREAMRIAKRARELDPACFLIVDDVRLKSTAGSGEEH